MKRVQPHSDRQPYDRPCQRLIDIDATCRWAIRLRGSHVVWDSGQTGEDACGVRESSGLAVVDSVLALVDTDCDAALRLSLKTPLLVLVGWSVWIPVDVCCRLSATGRPGTDHRGLWPPAV
jgi:hypothetical protein